MFISDIDIVACFCVRLQYGCHYICKIKMYRKLVSTEIKASFKICATFKSKSASCSGFPAVRDLQGTAGATLDRSALTAPIQ